MMTESLSLMTAFFLGLLGGGHCIGMCGGIMSTLSMRWQQQEKSTGFKRVLLQTARLLGYNLGRVASYTTMGFLIGLPGGLVGADGPGGGMLARSFAAVMLIAMGLYLGGWWMGLTLLERAGHTLWRRIGDHAGRLLNRPGPFSTVLAGMVWGWLPCGLVYSTLAWAAASQSAHRSASLMLFFGLGTVPVMLATGVLARQMQSLFRGRSFRSVAAIMVILFGVWTFPGPHQMWIMNKLTPPSSGQQSAHGHHCQSHTKEAGTLPCQHAQK